MREYRPDRWVLVRITNNKTGDVHHRFLAGWYGGFTFGDRWKLSSGLIEDQIMIRSDGSFESPQSSGSCYIVYPSSIGMSGYMRSVAHSFMEDAEASNGAFTFEVLSEDDALEFMRGK